MRSASMGELRVLGLAAESRMLRATGQVNTHRGAIFALGLLVAAAGLASSYGHPPSDTTLRNMIALHWRRELLAVPAAGRVRTLRHGQQVAARYGASGARGEAIDGFPAVFDVALPALRFALSRGAGARHAQLHAFFALLARIDDTNVLYRGGAEAGKETQGGCRGFPRGGQRVRRRLGAASGGVASLELERASVARRLRRFARRRRFRRPMASR